jgi:hypothetical protein
MIVRAIGSVTPASGVPKFGAERGRSRSRARTSAGSVVYAASQASAMPVSPMRPNWLKPRKSVTPSAA